MLAAALRLTSTNSVGVCMQTIGRAVCATSAAAAQQQLGNVGLHTSSLPPIARHTTVQHTVICFGLQRHKHTAADESKPPFSKILIANRGEIAVRVMKTARRMGIQTVAVYSEADRNAVHVRYADEAVCIGPPPSAQSYLNVDAILDAVKKTGAQAVHPGYGFLSENASFAEKLKAAGVVFVGPPVRAIAAMGDKVESKRIAKEAQVNTIPGWIGVVEDADHAVKLAHDIGFPLMIKASAGGGGKGMRIVRDEAELREGWDLCVQEAQAAFGDSRMLMEKYIEEPRHIEIQLIGDQHGTILYLPERECSIQRRNQKVVEEAPSTFTTPELREAMGKQAVQLAQAVGYYSAGTLEFLVDKHKNFYFLEMNTRLQVEHPITEYITQLDLVELMLRVAAGEKLPVTQEQVKEIHGWAVECRVYAEDPAKNFLPSIGRLQRYIEPSGDNVRLDSGVTEGSEISMYYDPMIGKLVTYGSTREQALKAMERSLDAYVIRGVANNLAMLRQIISHPAFVSGATNTAFLPDHFPNIAKPLAGGTTGFLELPVPPANRSLMLAMAAFHSVSRDRRLFSATNSLYRPALGLNDRTLVLSLDNDSYPATIRPASPQMVSQQAINEGALEIEVDGKIHQVCHDTSSGGGAPYCADLNYVSIDGASHIYQVMGYGPRSIVLQYAGVHREIVVQTPLAAQLSALMPKKQVSSRAKVVVSPMAGSVISIEVKAGDSVAVGSDLAVIEAMKMRNVLKAEVSGVVKEVKAKAGDVVKADQILIQFESTSLSTGQQ